MSEGANAPFASWVPLDSINNVSVELGEWALGEIRVRPAEFQVFVSDRRVPLTRREFAIFVCLAVRFDRVVTRQQMYEEVWGGAMATRDRSVDVFVRKVRKKLATQAPTPVSIYTHFGVGYRLGPA